MIEREETHPPHAADLIRYEHASVRFPGPGGRHVDALSDVSLAITRGEFISIIGPSGAGKSTLLRCANRLGRPTSGRIFLLGEDVTDAAGRRLRRVRQRCGMVFQQFNLVPRLTVIQNVLAGRIRFLSPVDTLLAVGARRFPEQDHQIALDCLELVGVEEQAYKRADQLSGGQQQRVAIARTLAQEPEVILADEPIASLDPRSAAIVMDTLARINRDRGIAVLVNLHQVDTAKRYSTRVIGMRAGRVAFDGPPDALDEQTLTDIYGSEDPHAVSTPPPARDEEPAETPAPVLAVP